MKPHMTGWHLALSFSLLILTMALGGAEAADNTDHFVSPDGSNGNDGATSDTPWATINYAVLQAAAADTIWVMDDDDNSTDDYVESVVVDKSLTIRAFDNDGTHPQIKTAYTVSPAILVEADNVTLQGLDVYGATAKWGIEVSHVEGITGYPMYNVVIKDCRAGWDATHTNRTGIYLHFLNDGSVSGCTANYNAEYGLLISNLSSETPGLQILDNTMSHNNYEGIYLDTSHGNTFRGNTVESNRWNCMYLNGSDGNQIEDNAFRNSTEKSGIRLSSGSENNTLKGNTSTGHMLYGIEINSSAGNRLYRNEFEGSSAAVSSNAANIWASPTAEDYGYESVSYNGILGNYYSDYAGVDADGDGIGDTAHDFVDPETQDDRPLVAPLSSYAFDLVILDGFEDGTTDVWSAVVGLIQ